MALLEQSLEGPVTSASSTTQPPCHRIRSPFLIASTALLDNNQANSLPAPSRCTPSLQHPHPSLQRCHRRSRLSPCIQEPLDLVTQSRLRSPLPPPRPPPPSLPLAPNVQRFCNVRRCQRLKGDWVPGESRTSFFCNTCVENKLNVQVSSDPVPHVLANKESRTTKIAPPRQTEHQTRVASM